MCNVATFPTKILTRVEFGAILWMRNQMSMSIEIYIFTYLVINYEKLEEEEIWSDSIPNVILCKVKYQVTYSSLQKHSHQIFVYMWLLPHVWCSTIDDLADYNFLQYLQDHLRILELSIQMICRRRKMSLFHLLLVWKWLPK